MAEEGGADDTVAPTDRIQEKGMLPQMDIQEQGDTVGIDDTNTPYHNLQMDILNHHHVEIRSELNFMAILPYLNRHGLIPVPDYDQLINMPCMIDLYTNYAKIDKLIYTIIPRCGHEDFLLRFIRSLRESAQDAGDAHTELAQSLNRALNSALGHNTEYGIEDTEDTESETATELTVMISGNGEPASRLVRRPRGNQDDDTNYRGQGMKGSSRVFFCCFFVIFGCLLLSAIAGTVLLAYLPLHSSLKLPLEIQTATGSLSELDLGLKTTWVSTVELQFTGNAQSDCSGSAHIVSGRSCGSLPVQEISLNLFFSMTYLLSGSQINITFDKTVFQADHVKAIWILSSISAYHTMYKMNNINPNYDSTPCTLQLAKEPDYHCYPANEYNLTHPIVFDVNSSGYYSYFVFGGVHSGIASYIDARTYNFTAIVEDKLIRTNVSLRSQSKVELYINNHFRFSRECCILLQSSCIGGNVPFTETDWTLLAVHKRNDLVLFPGLLVAIFVIILSFLFVLIVYLCVKRHRRRW